MLKTNKITQAIHSYVKNLLNRSSPFDGRWLILFSLIVYFSTLFISNFFVPYYQFWKKLGVPAEYPSFMDFRGVLAGFECTRLGYDVLLENPCDPWKRNIIYPRIWWKFTWLGLDQSHTDLICILLILIFYIITFWVIGRLNLYEGIIYSLFFCSPPIMLLIERGNVDLMMYIFSFIAVIMAQSNKIWLRIIGYITLLIPTFLKILSFFSLTIIIKEKRLVFLTWFFSLMTISIIYMYQVKDELSVAKQYLKMTKNDSFGYKILLKYFSQTFSSDLIFSRKINLVLVCLLILGLILLCWLIYQTFISILKIFNEYNLNVDDSKQLNQSINNNLLLDFFRLGSSFYLGTFLVTISFDYKFVFMIFTIPQIITWIKYDQRLAIPSSFALLGIILTAYLSPISLFSSFLLDEVINWSIWFYFLYAFVLTLPKWIKIPLHNLISAKAHN